MSHRLRLGEHPFTKAQLLLGQLKMGDVVVSHDDMIRALADKRRDSATIPVRFPIMVTGVFPLEQRNPAGGHIANPFRDGERRRTLVAKGRQTSVKVILPLVEISIRSV